MENLKEQLCDDRSTSKSTIFTDIFSLRTAVLWNVDNGRLVLQEDKRISGCDTETRWYWLVIEAATRAENFISQHKNRPVLTLVEMDEVTIASLQLYWTVLKVLGVKI